MEVKLLALFTAFALCKSTLGDEASWRCQNNLPDTTVVVGFQEKCYQFVDREVFWTSARNYCQLYGGRLVKINDPHTNDFIVRSLNALPWTNKGVWIGLHDRDDESNWEWVAENDNYGETLQWTNWARGHPRAFFHRFRDCIRMVRGHHEDWKWHETFCSALNWRYKYICEYRMEEATAAPPPQRAHFYQDNTEESHVAVVPKPDSHLVPHPEDVPSDTAYRHIKENDEDELTTKLPMTSHGTGDDYEYDDQYVDVGELIKPLALKEEEMENQKGITFVVLACTIGVISAVIILIIIVVSRRRRNKTMADSTLKIENPMYDTSCDNNDSQGQRPRIRNEYVINVYSNPIPLAVRLLNSKQCQVANEFSTQPPSVDEDNQTPAETAETPSTAEDGYEEPRKSHYLPMDGNDRTSEGEKASDDYDSPRLSNIYSEIPELDAENVYETLDDINSQKNESEA